MDLDGSRAFPKFSAGLLGPRYILCNEKYGRVQLRCYYSDYVLPDFCSGAVVRTRSSSGEAGETNSIYSNC